MLSGFVELMVLLIYDSMSLGPSAILRCPSLSVVGTHHRAHVRTCVGPSFATGLYNFGFHITLNWRTAPAVLRGRNTSKQ